MNKIKLFIKNNYSKVISGSLAALALLVSIAPKSASAQVSITPDATTTAMANIAGDSLNATAGQGIGFLWTLFSDYLIYWMLLFGAIVFIIYLVRRFGRARG